MEVILLLLILGVGLYVLNLRSRIEELSERLRLLEFPKEKSGALEIRPVAAPPPLPLPLPKFEHRPEPIIPEQMVSEPVIIRPPASVAPEPTLSDRLREFVGDQEWESLIGGSILNKLGAVVLVIGIALFLGFSFDRISPAGRAALSIVVSTGILCAGVWVERRERYRFFARGLIGAGWAALYATAYAIYAIPAAQIISNAFAGSVILLAVGAGMVLHSLKYRSQAVTGVAYFSAFAALAVTPSSPFAVISLIPLAASVLYLAAKFEWYSMAMFGMVATYGTCISRGNSNAPLGEVQALFLAYWLLFELFDLIRVKRRVVKGGVEWIYYGNLAGFLGLSWLAWSHHAPERLWFASAIGSAIFLADAIERAILRPPSSFDSGEGVGERLEAGSFEVSALVSALLGAASLVANVAGVWLSAGLAIEAEAIYLVGVRFASPFLEYLGIAAFAHSLVRLGLTPYGKGWTPPLVFHSVLFYVNRIVRRPNVLMSSAAAVLVAAVIFIETPVAWLGCGWIALAAALLEIGLWTRTVDFRGQAYMAAAMGAVAAVVFGGVPALGISLALVYLTAVRTKWLELDELFDLAVASSGIAVALAFTLLWRAVPVDYVAVCWFGLALATIELGNQKFPEQIRPFAAPAGALALAGLVFTHSGDYAQVPAPPVWISFFACAALAAPAALRTEYSAAIRQGFVATAAGLTIAGIWLVTPDPYVTILWTLVALAVLELRFRSISVAAFALIYGRMLLFDIDHSALISMPAAIAAIYWLWFRVRDNEILARVVFWLVPAPLLLLVMKTAGVSKTAPEFMLISLALLAAGIRYGLRDARLQSHIVAAVAFALALKPENSWIAIATVALLYAGQFVAKKSPEVHTGAGFSVGATLELTKLLFAQTSGELLTVSWGFEGLALLAAGFALRERVLRLQGLALLLVCILKLFIYDLRNLETLPRILSFIALGAIMLSVSWIYTRFRDHVRKLL